MRGVCHEAELFNQFIFFTGLANFLLGPALKEILPITTSQVAEIIGVSHHA
jgi:hypothetical protein